MDVISNIGAGELIFILIIILLVMGPHRLPEISGMLGQTLRKFQETYQEFVSEFAEELHTVEETAEEVREGVQTLAKAVDLPETPPRATTRAAPATKPTPKTLEELPTHNPVPCEKAKEVSPADD